MSTKKKIPAVVAKPIVKPSAKAPVRTKIDETRAAVLSGDAAKPISHSQPDTIVISSGSSSYDSDSDEDPASDADEAEKYAAPGPSQSTRAGTPPPEVKRVNGEVDTDMASPTEDAADADDTSPTFGDLMRGTTTTTTVDVSAALAAHQATPLSPLSAPSRTRALAPPPTSLSSLGTVLNQALRTDDNELLESCLQTSDRGIVTDTINRMDSTLAGALLAKIAARMHRRPGRALSLMRWVQYTLITHGGALASQADLMRKLADLNRVLEERSRGLPSLLALKGKLDMLDAQLKLRKSNLGRKRKAFDGDLDEEGQEGIIYVEGDEEVADNAESSRVNGAGRPAQDQGPEGEDDFPLANGVESDSDDSDDSDDMEEVDDEDMTDGEVDHDDVEEESGEDESDAEATRPAAKVRKVTSSFTKRKTK